MTDLHSSGMAVDKPFVAGMYDYYLGGRANTAVDRAAVDRIRWECPEIVDVAWANRGFLQRAVTWMAERGVTQFLDIGAGLPTQRNTHEVVAEVAPGGRVVYVDIDPRVVERGRELLGGAENTAIIQGDVRRPDEILGHPQTRRLLDFTEPVGLLLVAVTQFVPDSDDPWTMVATYVSALSSGSYVALSAPTGDMHVRPIVDDVLDGFATTPASVTERSKEEIGRFFTGLEIVPPYDGAKPTVTYVGEWGAEDPELADSYGSRWFYAGLGRKP